MSVSTFRFGFSIWKSSQALQGPTFQYYTVKVYVTLDPDTRQAPTRLRVAETRDDTTQPQEGESRGPARTSAASNELKREMRALDIGL